MNMIYHDRSLSRRKAAWKPLSMIRRGSAAAKAYRPRPFSPKANAGHGAPLREKNVVSLVLGHGASRLRPAESLNHIFSRGGPCPAFASFRLGARGGSHNHRAFIERCSPALRPPRVGALGDII
jgi:hypothetical protein